jgi:hypothetical protein
LGEVLTNPLCKKTHVKDYPQVEMLTLETKQSGGIYGCETWSLTLREEHRLRVFDNRVLRKVFGPRRDEVTWEWRKLHNEKLCTPYPIMCGWKNRDE